MTLKLSSRSKKINRKSKRPSKIVKNTKPRKSKKLLKQKQRGGSANAAEVNDNKRLEGESLFSTQDRVKRQNRVKKVIFTEDDDKILKLLKLEKEFYIIGNPIKYKYDYIKNEILLNYQFANDIKYPLIIKYNQLIDRLITLYLTVNFKNVE